MVLNEPILPHQGRRRGVHPIRTLIEWVSEYRHRTSSSSFKGHHDLFEAYDGPKLQLRTPAEISMFAENVDDVISGTKN